MAARTEPWVCVFGSNLFHQLDPDDRTNSTKKIGHPRNLKDTRIPSNSPRYQAVTISDNGEVLAALSAEGSRTFDLKTEKQLSHHLELWPGFQELLDFCHDGVKPNSNPKSIKLESSLLGQTEIQLSSGASHFLILTHTPSTLNHRPENDDPDYHSTLYTFGDNRFGQLGIGSRSVSVDEPQRIENLPALSSIDCGLFHSLALGKGGELYTFGHNRKGQCGVGSSKIDTTTPILIDLGGNGEAGDIIDVIDARCGSEHTVVLASSGVWVTGSNALGQLGMKHSGSHFEFQRNKNVPTEYHENMSTALNIQTGRWNTLVWRNS
ncbi:hypothetical protein PTTG_01585 [Puccinia triticina 1-1 BBBD Race 1]|uniref:Uncharacterized protein n=1 Tax=Puccinia triticina (isolate 1-1 / race 1 (BBBD)) TaxID=630390 RepID=A0A180GKU6_PUCT1|nr:hypothetical protein PTTG_01585 [Puccinia triticina 1-1 BBBD Race 1]